MLKVKHLKSWEALLRKEYRKEELNLKALAYLYRFPPEPRPISYDFSKVVDLYRKGAKFILTQKVGGKVDFHSCNLLDHLKSENCLLTPMRFIRFTKVLSQAIEQSCLELHKPVNIDFVGTESGLFMHIYEKPRK